MKTKILIFSSLIALCMGTAARGSDCIGADCDIEPIGGNTPTVLGVIEETTVTDVAPDLVTARVATAPQVIQYAPQTQYVYAGVVPMRNIKTLSIKPVPADDRRKLWDGTHGEYKARGYDKTVDWRDGVPIWDDSIVNYKKKDFSDWYLEPAPEIYLREIDSPSESIFATYGTPATAVVPTAVDPIELYNQNMADAAETRARVEELLAPRRPSENLWTEDTTANVVVADTVVEPDDADMLVVNNFNGYHMPAPRPEFVAQDMSSVIAIAFGGDGCPFDSETECEIWRRKPMVRETVAPRSNRLRPELMADFINNARCNRNIDASDPSAAPLVARYKMLMRSAQACCTDGMVYSLRQAGASDGLIYKFMADDANFYNLGSRCLMLSDAELDAKYPNTATAAVAADVRNGCLCRGRQWFSAMLAPFQEAYQASPEFARSKFMYTYTDGLQRKITVSINNDVQNVLDQLDRCP